MLRPADQWFLSHPEPARSCLLQLRQYILHYSPDVEERWSYGMPFYYFGQKRLVWLWFHKKHKLPYIGFVDGNLLNEPDLLKEERSRMKIKLIEPDKAIPLKRLNELVGRALRVK
jgi:hypothetical protein